ncbi:carboxypeptidase-like regulatory domain-containing protein [Aestuariibaculum sediminum]|uniref:Carboxypeptidase-like regulatory domain-containing protein n=1 Tax=Aestuariibaculum sediminum TaxID=2770637 RepID=A0A8J6U6N4_9FLAO|nr:carboxypeptidase-like regulatory domain-containing protein [Aestuariibaculum sediminum]MBD0830895.1 carboxypeptidase-like regulatory domain-containing protein [Aestuariibaculum sediminum]
MRTLLLLFVLLISLDSEGQIVSDKNQRGVNGDVLKDITLTGNVTDINSLDLIGAELVIKGTSIMTKTNFDGNFNLKCKKGCVLVVSYTGFETKEVTIENQTNINIVLEEKGNPEPMRSLTKSEVRKIRRSDKKLKQADQRENERNNMESVDLKEVILEEAGRATKRSMWKHRK